MSNKNKSPEEIMKEIEKLKRQYEQAETDLKESRKAAITEGVRKAGAEFSEVFDIYLGKRKGVSAKEEQIAILKADLQGDLQYLKDQYNFIRDTLVGESVKEEYLVDVIGHPPTVKAAATPGTVTEAGTGVGKKRTKAKLPDGTTSTWNNLLATLGIAHIEGNSAHREYDAAKAANPNLPDVEVVYVK